jgi:hypothetical protein
MTLAQVLHEEGPQSFDYIIIKEFISKLLIVVVAEYISIDSQSFIS